MMRFSFRQRLLFGHILPILILAPIIGFALVSLIETRLVIPTLANDMIDEGFAVARITQGNDHIWESQPQAQALLDSIPLRPPTFIGLISRNGILLATNRPEDRDVVGQSMIDLQPSSELPAQVNWAVNSEDPTGDPTLAVNVPVTSPSGVPLGSVRIYRRIVDIDQIFVDLRIIIITPLVLGLILSSVSTFLISASFNRSLQHLTQLIADAPLEGAVQALPEEGDQELRTIIRAYNHLQARRQELEQTRELLLMRLVHEIGRPLGSLRTAIHALQSGALSDPELRNDLFQGMTDRIMWMGRLIQDLSLGYRKLAPQELDIQEIGVSAWLNTLTPLWQASAQENELSWSCSVAEDITTLQADPDRLAQALGNVVSNGIKYTPPGGEVGLKVLRSSTQIFFIIQDNGPGIPLEDQPHLFSPFFRGRAGSQKIPGLGLGLSIAKSIIDSMGGEIALDSRPGQGSTFTITLPLE